MLFLCCPSLASARISLLFILSTLSLAISNQFSLLCLKPGGWIFKAAEPNMCDSSRLMFVPCARSYLGCRHHRPLHRHPLRVFRLMRRRRLTKEEAKKDKENTAGVKVEMEIKNLKLYMENQSIIEENEKLRKKAFLLHKENQVLLSQLQSVSNQKQQPPV